MGDQFNLEAVIKEHILQVWVCYFKNTSRAAKALGIGRTTLYRKLRAYGEDTSSKMERV
jgi:transcriptional regulator of acetoin/glycerol metabolism